MPYTRVSNFQFKPGAANRGIDLAKRGLLPVFQKTAGFQSYCIVMTEGDRGTSMATWETREQADAAMKQAAQWIQSNLSDVSQLDQYVGELALEFETTASGGDVIQAIHDAFNAKDLDRLAKFLQPGAMMRTIPFGDEQSIRDYFQTWATAFPDGKIEQRKYTATADTVVCEFIGRGTHTGSLRTPTGPIAPTNKRVEVRFVDIYDLRDGKVSGGRLYFDVADFMRQLGIAPAMPLPTGKAATRPEVRH